MKFVLLKILDTESSCKQKGSSKYFSCSDDERKENQEQGLLRGDLTTRNTRLPIRARSSLRLEGRAQPDYASQMEKTRRIRKKKQKRPESF